MIKKILFAAIALTVSGCTDKLTVSALNGTFAGKFYYMPPSETTIVSADAEVSFSDSRYSSKGNTGYVPAGGSGTFEIQENHILDFKDQNIWTANFDWGLILNGKYSYEINGDSLILNRFMEPCIDCSMAPSTYQYRLKRSK